MSNFKPNYFQRRSKPQGPKANERIRALDVQVIGSDGGNLGTMPLKKAIELGADGSRTSNHGYTALMYYLDDDKLDERVNNFCKQVCGHTPQVLSLTKDTLYKQISMPIDQAYNFTSQAMVDNLQMPETKKGVQSFLKKD